MRYFHDCGGIHACGPAWEHLDWECVGTTEIEPFPIAVVKHHYPHIKQHGDTTKVSLDGANLDLLIGGTPCQGFSVAGKRGGLDDSRSNLAWNFLRLARESNSRWIIWENVPGASSTNEGQDLLAFTQEVGKLGYGYAWRTLDAQFFGVPQRRRRIFLVGYFGDWRPAAAVLFESHCLSRNPQTSRKKRQTVATDARNGAPCYRYQNETSGIVGDDITATLRAESGTTDERSVPAYIAMFENHAQDSRIKQVEICPQLNAKDGTGGNNLPIVFTHKDSWLANGSDVSPTMQAKNHNKSHANDSSSLAVCFLGRAGSESTICDGPQAPTLGATRPIPDVFIAPTLTASNDPSRSPQSQEVTQQVEAVLKASGTVRRLTPRECARLQGFPDDWCKIPWRGKPAEQCPDGPQYKAYGNSIAVPVLKHLGNRITLVERLIKI